MRENAEGEVAKLDRQQFADWLKRQGAFHRRIVVLTGAGISAESGIPTFRGRDGLWRNMDPSDLFTPEALMRDPVLVWEMYDELRTRIAAASPNAGHYALAALGRRREMTLVTQNIDGLHQRAGSERVYELHGSLWRIRCTNCDDNCAHTHTPLSVLPPRCGRCGAVMRPDIVLFSEALPEDVLQYADQAVEQCDLMLVVGTSGVVYPAAALPMTARRRGALVLEINPQDTALTGEMDYVIRATAADALPWVVEVLVDEW